MRTSRNIRNPVLSRHLPGGLGRRDDMEDSHTLETTEKLEADSDLSPPLGSCESWAPISCMSPLTAYGPSLLKEAMLEKAWKRPCWPAHVRGLWAACAHLHLGRMFFLLRGAVLGASVSTVSGFEMGRDVSCLWEASSCLCFEQSCVCQNTRPSYLVQGFDAQGLEIPSSYSASPGPQVGSVGFLGKDRNPETRLLNQMSRCP